MRLGLMVLKLEDHFVQAALTNNKGIIKDTAFYILKTWRSLQLNSQDAYRTLYTQLVTNGWGYLASELKDMSTGDTKLIPQYIERKLLSILFVYNFSC